jgi:hypothetical protein
MLKQYFMDLSAWVRESANVADASDGDFYAVVGRSPIHGRPLNIPRVVVDMGVKARLLHAGSRRYRLVNQRMRYLFEDQPRVEEESVLHFCSVATDSCVIRLLSGVGSPSPHGTVGSAPS